MNVQGSQHEISWTQFELCNANPQIAFENLCRWLFNEFFLTVRCFFIQNRIILVSKLFRYIMQQAIRG